MIIMKFGGTSVGSPENIKKIIIIVKSKKERIAGIVVSAYTKVTDQLLEMATLASKNDKRYLDIFRSLEERHLNSVKELIKNPIKQNSALKKTQIILKELKNILQGVFLMRESSLKTYDLIASFGERLSAYIISESFNDQEIKAEFVDTRSLVKTDNQFNNALVDFIKTDQKIKKYFEKNFKNKLVLPIITGFVGSTDQDETTTLGRGGSDYTASIFGAALNCDLVEIWTDVDGVMTCNPRQVKSAFSLSKMTYYEAMEMSHFGAKVIYSATMKPVMRKKIPIVIKNTFNPKFKGTIISRESTNDYLIKGISSINNVAVFLVQGSGMADVSPLATRVFDALAKKRINILFITQGSSENIICFGLFAKDVNPAKMTIEDEFKHEIKYKVVDPIIIEKDKAIVAITGENMKNKSGIAGKLFGVLGENQINIIAIAQGSSERNITVTIDMKDENKALNVIHKTFFGI